MRLLTVLEVEVSLILLENPIMPKIPKNLHPIQNEGLGSFQKIEEVRAN